LNRESPKRRGVPSNDGGPIEAVTTSRADGDRMFVDAVAAERTHLRRLRVRARLSAEGDAPATYELS
jgi:hypothetical protein